MQPSPGMPFLRNALAGAIGIVAAVGCAQGTTSEPLGPVDSSTSFVRDAGDPKPMDRPDASGRPDASPDAGSPDAGMRDAHAEDAIIEPGRDAMPDVMPMDPVDADVEEDASSDASVPEDAAAGDCEGLTYQGECRGNVARWCSSFSNTVIEVDCSETGEECQWVDETTGYFCTGSAEDPDAS